MKSKLEYQIGEIVNWKVNSSKKCIGIVRQDDGSDVVEVRLVDINRVKASCIINVKRELLKIGY